MIQVKQNCSKLYKIVKQTAQNTPVSTYTEIDKPRKVTRTVDVFCCPQTLPNDWKYIHTIVKVRRIGQRYYRSFDEVSYFVSSQTQTDAQSIAQGIRGHWGIENRLHWVKDVVFNEDRNKIRCPKIAANLSLMFNFALNLMRGLGFRSIKFATEHFANRVKELYCLFNNRSEKTKPIEN